VAAETANHEMTTATDERWPFARKARARGRRARSADIVTLMISPIAFSDRKIRIVDKFVLGYLRKRYGIGPVVGYGDNKLALLAAWSNELNISVRSMRRIIQRLCDHGYMTADTFGASGHLKNLQITEKSR